MKVSKYIKAKVCAIVAGIGVVVASVAQATPYDPTADITALVTTVETDVTNIAGKGWVLFGAMIGIALAIKLVQRFIGSRR